MSPSTVPGQTQKSTIVRIGALRAGLNLLGRLSVPLAAVVLERLLSTPPRRRRPRGSGPLSTGRRFPVEVDGRSVAAWGWGDGGPAVLLVHGWGGQAAQMTSFVAPLVDRGFRVVVFDGPGHGRSGRGMSSAPELARASLAVAATVRPLHAVVAHSLGAAATVIALKGGLATRRVAFVAPMMDPVGRLGEIASLLGIQRAVAARMRARSERRIGVDWDDLRWPALAADIGVPALVVHDRNDAEVPVSHGRSIAAHWSEARFVETAGLGHNRVLRSAAVIDEVVAFVTRGVERCPCGAPKGPQEVCEGCGLQQELFDRESRRLSSSA
jgi:pimeloyl-ACP methyl ester carboxylesterase